MSCSLKSHPAAPRSRAASLCAFRLPAAAAGRISCNSRLTSERNNCQARFNVFLCWASRGTRGSIAASPRSRPPRSAHQQHPMRHLEPRRQPLRVTLSAVDTLHVPVHKVVLRGCALTNSFRPGLLLQLQVLIMRRVGHHPSPCRRTLLPRPPADPGNPCAQDARLLLLNSAQPREQHRDESGC